MIVVDNENKIKFVDQYKVLKTVSISGYSNVYLVEDTNDNNKKYALKAIRNSNERIKLQNEINIYHKISNHKNILGLKKAFKSSKRSFLLFDYASNDLKNVVQKNGVMKEEEIFHVLKNLLSVLKFTHKSKIIHNDIKPANILVENKQYFLCDWGLSINSESAKTSNIDTDRGFIPPEMFYGNFDLKSDIYSLGCTLYYLCTGKKIFDINKDSLFSYVMYSHCFLHPDLEHISSDKLKFLISNMIEKKPEDRLSLAEIETIIDCKKTYDYTCRKNNHLPYMKKNSFELYDLLKNNQVLYAYNNLGFLYENYEKNRDINKARELYEEAAKKGLTTAMYNLGALSSSNDEETRDINKAFYWLTKASDNNHEKAQYSLGLLYEEGLGVEKDMSKAISLYKNSAYAGYKKAYTRLKELHKQKLNFKQG